MVGKETSYRCKKRTGMELSMVPFSNMIFKKVFMEQTCYTPLFVIFEIVVT